MRLAAHKGPPAAERVMAVPAGAMAVEATLPAQPLKVIAEQNDKAARARQS